MTYICRVDTVLIYITVGLCLLILLNIFRKRNDIKIETIKTSFFHLRKQVFFIVACSIFFLVAYCGSKYMTNKKLPILLMKFNYEEAAKGQNPNKTRFNASKLLSSEILESVIEKGGFSVSADELSGCLELASSYDEQEINAQQPAIATEYRVICTEDIFQYDIDSKTLMSLLADVYYEYFMENFSENDSILKLNFDDMDSFDYMDLDDYFQKKAESLKQYIRDYSYEDSTYRVGERGETFSSLAEKVDNFINVELERYRSFVLENGLSKESEEYKKRMEYQNRLLQVDYEKKMAAYNVRLETIEMYDEQMARIVLVPTTDEELEFYMSRTKIGADYFADEADTALANATSIQKDMDHNDYAKKQIIESTVDGMVYTEADTMIANLKTELNNLSEQAKTLCDSYIEEKRNGYLMTGIASVSVSEQTELRRGLEYTVFFTVMLCGFLMAVGIKKERKNKVSI